VAMSELAQAAEAAREAAAEEAAHAEEEDRAEGAAAAHAAAAEAEGAGARIYEYDRPGIDRMIDAEMERGGAHEPVAP
jgi:hypothetical protein